MSTTSNKIAVIGMACRFPGARNLDEYWNNLILGKDTIKHFTDEELSEFEFDFDNLRNNPDYVKARGILDDIDKFDAGFFGMTPKEAAGTDPQHRIWLETAWEAFENAGCDPINYQGAIGVFSGGYLSTYLLNNILRDPKILENFIRLRSAESYQILTGNDLSFISTKTAYKFNLKGPAINVQTACSTSLVAIAQACQSLYSFESDICLAGGVCISVPQESGYIYQEGAIPSPDGSCRPFDAQAKGTVSSNGVGTVILKRMEDAVRDQDKIYALVRGWALNNDGSNKVSYTAPGIDGQAEVIMMAQSFADVSPEDISYIEAHGTATHLGDPIEIAALKKAFSKKTDKKQFCGIGSVKSNIGHTDAAAGVASFIKTCLAVYYKRIPATIHFSEPNMLINFEETPFFVQSELKEWTEERPLIMGVSSFGIGGTNAHVIIEEPPSQEKTGTLSLEWPELILLSARSEYSLSRRKKDLIDYVKANPGINIHDVAYTLASGRNHMQYRTFLVASGIEEIISGADNFTDGKTNELISKIAFMFPGQGAQYVTMGKNLYNSNILFRQLLDECFEIVSSETGKDLKYILFESTNNPKSEEKLASTEMAQPALFIIEYALARILMQFEIKPAYLIGHSIGEYTAACIAGVFDMTTALKIVIKRGQLMGSMRTGKMIAVRTSIEQLRNLNNSSFEIAADNAPALCTISFKSENTEKVKTMLDKNDIQYMPLNTSHAFHSAAFDPILNEFSEFVNQFSLNAPVLPFISCLTGEFITPEQATSGSYWAQQLRNTVMFRKGISLIVENEDVIFLEVGPNTHLSSLVRQSKEVVNNKAIISTLGKVDSIEDGYKVITALGYLYNIGININSDNFYKDIKPDKISLPTYPFERKRHWIDFKLPEVTNNQKDLINNTIGSGLPENDIISEDTGRNVLISSGKETDKILNIWKSVIGLEEICLDKDFFELGGHSLLALQIITRIREELHQNVSLKTFLENPTINRLYSTFNKDTVYDITEFELVHLTDLQNLPLSNNQKRLWIITQLNRFNPAYNIPLTYHLNGQVNTDLFQKTMNILFNRHHVMFSVFKQIEGYPYCSIEPKPVNVEFIDFSDITPQISKEKILTFIGEDSQKPFNIEIGPLYRLYLLKQNDFDFYFHATIHHLIFDGWSWSIFIHDFIEIYTKLILNKDIKLEVLKFQHYDYAYWKEKAISPVEENKLKEFWVNNLKDAPLLIKFPFDFPREITPSGLGCKEYIQIAKEDTFKLRDFSKRENVTLFVSLLSAYGLLMQRYSGDNDICIGTPVANRPHSELEKMIGMFVDTIIIRLKFDNIRTFKDLIELTKSTTLEAIAHQELSFEKIVEAVKPERLYNVNPIFQVCFAWQNNLSIPMNFEKVKGERVTVKEGISPFDLTFYMWENGDIIEGEIEYNSDIFKHDTIIRLRDNFLTLIHNLVKNFEWPLISLPSLSEVETKKILSFTDTKTNYPKEKTIIQLFEEQVRLYPDKKAVVFRWESKTYKQLNERANQLARTLRALGVNSNTTVGILAEKSVDMIVGILGILKAGGGYVPVDPEYPDQRIDFIIKDSGCKVLLTQDKYTKVAVEGVTKINLNSPSSYHREKSDLQRINSWSDLAYIMYTSGTTGIPKGSMILQYSVVRLVRNTNYIELSSEDRILLTGAIVFDATTFEIWGALLNGGCLYLVEKETILNPRALGEELIENDITILWLTSPLFTEIAEQRTDIFSKLKYLLVGGDVLSAPHINKVRKDNPKLKVINGYGPTENTTFSATYLIDRDFEHNIPIGKPISNSTAYIFDKNLYYQPIGVIGELYVGGDGLSKGYLKREDLTEKSFIDHPHIPGGRLYRTGDYAKWLADGNIEFHGRIDNQLKIRGFRVELEEIEAVISEIEGIIETVIKPVKIKEGDVRLAAFLNVSETFSLDIKELSSRIKEKLPPYMIPSAYRFMHGLPKTINGKIDKDALTLDINDLVSKDSQDLGTITPTEKVIFNIWSEALKTKDISVTDNFFEIGGNSLLAISVSSKIESAFNAELGLRVFFDSPKIRDLAEAIDIATQKPVENNYGDKTPQSKSNIIKGEI